MKKRLIAKLMVTALLITSMPVTVFAKDTSGEVFFEENEIVINEDTEEIADDNSDISDENIVSEENQLGADLEIEDDEILTGSIAGKCGDNASYKVVREGDKYIVTISGKGAMYDYGDVDTLNGYYSSSPWSQALYATNGAVEIVIEKGITHIGNMAFAGICGKEDNNKLSISDTVESIGDGAFYEFYLSNIIIPGSVKTIGNRAFEGSTLNIPAGGQTVRFNEGLEYIGKSAFARNRLKTVTFPDSLKEIDDEAFNGGYLESVDLNKVEVIGEYAFLGFNTLKKFDMGDCLRIIGKRAFWAMQLDELVWSDKIEEIGEEAFLQSNISSVELTNNLKYIDKDAFALCENLSEITIPSSVEYIEAGALGKKNANDLKIKTADDNKMWREATPYPGSNGSGRSFDITTDYFSHADKGLIPVKGYDDEYAPENLKFDYDFDTQTLTVSAVSGNAVIPDCDGLKRNPIWWRGDYGLISRIVIGDGITRVGDYALCLMNGYKELSIGPDVKEIGDYAFYGMTLLDKVELSEGLEKIGDYAFASGKDSNELEKIILPNTLKTIGVSAFEGDNKLDNVKMGNAVEKIGARAFKNTNIRSIGEFDGDDDSMILPDTLKVIEKETFLACHNLDRIHLNDSIEKIEYNAFGGCKSLDTVNLGNGVKVIDEQAFVSCAIDEIEIPDSVVDIKSLAFAENPSLYTIKIGKGVKHIGSDAFNPYFRNSHIPYTDDHFYVNFKTIITFAKDSALERIDEYAFYAVSSTGIEIPDSVNKIGRLALGIPKSVEYSGDFYTIDYKKHSIKDDVGKTNKNGEYLIVPSKTIYRKVGDLDVFNGDKDIEKPEDDPEEQKNYADKVGAVKLKTNFYGGEKDFDIAGAKFADDISEEGREIDKAELLIDDVVVASTETGELGIKDDKKTVRMINSDNLLGGKYSLVIYAIKSPESADVTATVPVTVYEPIRSIDLDVANRVWFDGSKAIKLKIGMTFNGKISTPKSKNVVWNVEPASSGVSIAGGKLTLDKGASIPDGTEFVIKAKANDFSTNEVEGIATVLVKNQKLQLSEELEIYNVSGNKISQNVINVGEFKANGLCVKAKDDAGEFVNTITYKSSKPKIIAVDAKTGKLTALKAGTAIITATATDGGKAISKAEVTSTYWADYSKLTAICDKVAFNDSLEGNNDSLLTTPLEIRVADPDGNDFATDKMPSYTFKVKGGKLYKSKVSENAYKIYPSAEKMTLTLKDTTKKTDNTFVYTIYNKKFEKGTKAIGVKPVNKGANVIVASTVSLNEISPKASFVINEAKPSGEVYARVELNNADYRKNAKNEDRYETFKNSIKGFVGEYIYLPVNDGGFDVEFDGDNYFVLKGNYKLDVVFGKGNNDKTFVPIKDKATTVTVSATVKGKPAAKFIVKQKASEYTDKVIKKEALVKSLSNVNADGFKIVRVADVANATQSVASQISVGDDGETLTVGGMATGTYSFVVCYKLQDRTGKWTTTKGAKISLKVV